MRPVDDDHPAKSPSARYEPRTRKRDTHEKDPQNADREENEVAGSHGRRYGPHRSVGSKPRSWQWRRGGLPPRQQMHRYDSECERSPDPREKRRAEAHRASRRVSGATPSPVPNAAPATRRTTRDVGSETRARV